MVKDKLGPGLAGRGGGVKTLIQMQEEETSKLIDQEDAAIEQMCKRAAECGLLAEVVLAFGVEMKAGFSVAEACFHALYEWDC